MQIASMFVNARRTCKLALIYTVNIMNTHTTRRLIKMVLCFVVVIKVLGFRVVTRTYDALILGVQPSRWSQESKTTP